jgi:hypothetical protein
MLTMTDVRNVTKKWGFNFSPQVFWKYHKMGLLPKGEKIKGRGNVVYFPESTPQRLFAVHWMTNVVGIPLPEMKRINNRRWDSPTAMDIIVLMTLAIADLELWDKRLSKEELATLAQTIKERFESIGVKF